MCKEWLEAHSHNNDRKVAYLKHNLLQIKSNSEDPPKLLDNKSCTVTDIISVLKVCYQWALM